MPKTGVVQHSAFLHATVVLQPASLWNQRSTSCRLEKAVAKLPKKDLAAVKKRFAFLEVLQPKVQVSESVSFDNLTLMTLDLHCHWNVCDEFV